MILNCDAVVWMSYQKEDEIHTKMTFFCMPNKVKPKNEMGFLYKIIMFQSPEDANIGMFEAILGDPKGYIERLGRLGYHGLMFKDKVKGKKVLNEMITKMLTNWGFTEPQAKKAMKMFPKRTI